MTSGPSMAGEWEWMKAGLGPGLGPGFGGYVGGPNVVATCSSLPFQPHHSPSVASPSPFPRPPSAPLGTPEGGRHAFLPPLAPARPAYTVLAARGEGEVEVHMGQAEEQEEQGPGVPRVQAAARTGIRLGKDEKRAREAGVMINVKQDIIGLPMDEFNDLIGRQGYSEHQLNLCRDIRKRGKNKQAAQSCRKRKLGQIDELGDRLDSARRARDELRAQHNRLVTEYSGEADRLQLLTNKVLHHHQKSPHQWTVQVTGEDVQILPKAAVPDHQRFPPPPERYCQAFHSLMEQPDPSGRGAHGPERISTD